MSEATKASLASKYRGYCLARKKFLHSWRLIFTLLFIINKSRLFSCGQPKINHTTDQGSQKLEIFTVLGRRTSTSVVKINQLKSGHHVSLSQLLFPPGLVYRLVDCLIYGGEICAGRVVHGDLEVVRLVQWVEVQVGRLVYRR